MLPDAYKLQLENPYVRVVRVHYDAGAKLPSHAHGAGTTIYVYLNDSDGVVFRHTGEKTFVVTRQPVKTGAVRVSVARDEHHAVENTSKTPSDFLRIVLKTDPAGASGSRRLAPGDDTFANAQLRITRLRVEQHDSATVAAKQPALLIEIPSGTTRWVEAGQSAVVENHEVPELSLLRIDFLTAPK